MKGEAAIPPPCAKREGLLPQKEESMKMNRREWMKVAANVGPLVLVLLALAIIRWIYG